MSQSKVFLSPASQFQALLAIFFFLNLHPSLNTFNILFEKQQRAQKYESLIKFSPPTPLPQEASARM